MASSSPAGSRELPRWLLYDLEVVGLCLRITDHLTSRFENHRSIVLRIGVGQDPYFQLRANHLQVDRHALGGCRICLSLQLIRCRKR